MTQHRLAGGVLALCALAGLAGCGGGDDDDATAETAAQDAGDQADATETLATGAPAPEPTPAPTVPEVNSLTDFGDVCRGVKLDGATPYDPSRAGVHPLMTLAGEPPEYDAAGALLPDKWDPAIGSEQTVELVVCLDRMAATKSQTCTGYLDDAGNDSGNTVEMYDTTYTVRLLTATTAEEVATTQMDATEPNCPTLALFDEGDPVREEYAEPTDALTAWLVQYVET